MTDRVRVGVVGTGLIVDWCHLPAIKSHPRAELAAICGRTPNHVDELAKKHGIPLIYTDYREMIEKGDLDAVVVATPDDLHYPMTMAALDAGLHVLCEKPLALNAQHAREMYEKAEARGVKHMVFLSLRTWPRYRHLKRLVDEGYVGRLFSGHFRYLGSFNPLAAYKWSYDRQRACGVLGNFGSHMMDLARWLGGDVARVSAHLGVYVDRPRPDGQAYDRANDTATAIVEFASGAVGVIELSSVVQMGERGQEQYVTLHGEKGTLEVTPASGEIRGVQRGEKEFRSLPVPDELWGSADRSKHFDMYTKLPIGPRLFIDAIVDDLPISSSFYDGMKAQEVMSAAIESHETGRWVAL